MYKELHTRVDVVYKCTKNCLLKWMASACQQACPGMKNQNPCHAIFLQPPIFSNRRFWNRMTRKYNICLSESWCESLSMKFSIDYCNACSILNPICIFQEWFVFKSKPTHQCLMNWLVRLKRKIQRRMQRSEPTVDNWPAGPGDLEASL